MMELFFVSVFYEYDHCDHVGIFSDESKAIAALDEWVADHSERTGYSAEIRRFAVDQPYAHWKGPFPRLTYKRSLSEGEVTSERYGVD